MDVNDLTPGQRFEDELRKVLATCDVLIAIIGPLWLSLLVEKAGAGERDYVRAEIAAALQRSITVIPVLVGRAGRLPSVPRREDLPSDIRDLVSHQSHAVTHERAERDIADLGDAIVRLHPRTFAARPKLARATIIALLGIAAIGAAAFLGLRGREPSPETKRPDDSQVKIAKPSVPPAGPGPVKSADEQAWESAERKSLIKYWDAYLQLMPQGKFAPVARERIAKRRDQRLIGFQNINWAGTPHGHSAIDARPGAEDAMFLFDSGQLHRYNWKNNAAALIHAYGDVRTRLRKASFSPSADKLAFFGTFPAPRGADLTDPDEYKVVRLVRLTDPKIVHKLTHQRQLDNIAWCGNQETLLSADIDDKLHVWDLKTYTSRTMPRPHARPNKSLLVCSPDGRFAVTDTFTQIPGNPYNPYQLGLAIWDLSTLKETRASPVGNPVHYDGGGRQGVVDGLFFADGRRVAALVYLGFNKSILLTFDISSASDPKIIFSENIFEGKGLALSADERRAVTITKCGISVFDLVQGEETYPRRQCHDYWRVAGEAVYLAAERPSVTVDPGNEIAVVTTRTRRYVFDLTGF